MLLLIPSLQLSYCLCLQHTSSQGCDVLSPPPLQLCVHHIWLRIIGGGGRISPWNVPSELWDLAHGEEDGNGRKDKRKRVEGRHKEDKEADGGGKHLKKARKCQQRLLWPEGLKNKTEINNGNSTGNESETCTFPWGGWGGGDKWRRERQKI